MFCMIEHIVIILMEDDIKYKLKRVRNNSHSFLIIEHLIEGLDVVGFFFM